ncbi:hypothetical protein [Pelomonas sp. Root1217]|uniref:hypothetical protein n=1 Tax=Pelomonas sp. Root1217 TaxID=1736430 RepID=UPI0012FCDBF6|nr:hypothetical protein [Pelomonas sp. Root1217]
MNSVVHTIDSSSGKRRLQVVRRADGLFGYQEQYCYTNALAGVDRWASLPPTSSLFESLEAAVREAPYLFEWLAADHISAQPCTAADGFAAR